MVLFGRGDIRATGTTSLKKQATRRGIINLCSVSTATLKTGMAHLIQRTAEPEDRFLFNRPRTPIQSLLPWWRERVQWVFQFSRIPTVVCWKATAGLLFAICSSERESANPYIAPMFSLI